MTAVTRPRAMPPVVVASAVAVAVVATGALAGCGSRPGGQPAEPAPSAAPASGDRRLVPASYEGRYRTTATVLESPSHGPQLCSAVAESYPPQCGGPDVAGWDWSAVASESAAGTTWGTYRLVGTYAEGTFTLTEPATVDDGTGAPSPPEDDVDRFATPCPEPDGGWVPVDPERATEDAAQRAHGVAMASEGFAALWVDQRMLAVEVRERTANDPQRYVLNVSTTGDVAALEAALREEWGGSLCVSAAPRSEAELLAVQPRLSELPGFVSSGPDPIAGVVDVTLVHATEEQQRALDDELGEGLVRLSGVLEPID